MAKRKTSKKAAKKVAKKALTKSEVFATIAKNADLSKRQVASVFDELSIVIKKNLSSRGPGMFTLPGLCKMVTKNKPATKKRPGRNPFTGESIIIKAKPASKTVRIRALKNLKEMIK